jgi:hypothetical protein
MNTSKITHINGLSLSQQRDLLLDVLRITSKANNVDEAKRIVNIFDSRDLLSPNQRRLLEAVLEGSSPNTLDCFNLDVHKLSEKLSLTTQQVRGCLGSMTSTGLIVTGQAVIKFTESGLKAYKP